MNETTTEKLNLSTLFSKQKTKKGEATAGKTQLCLRLLLTAQLPEELGGLDGSALWLCSEKGDPPVRRLAQLARGCESSISSNWRPLSSAAAASASAAAAAAPISHAAPSTDNVFVEKGLATPADLMDALDRMEPLMTAATAGAGGVGGGKGARRRRRIRLVVIDSIAALFRDATAAAAGPTDTASADGGGASRCRGGGSGGGVGSQQRSLYAARAAALFAVASRLKRLADDHALAVVVVNQVTDVISDGLGEDAGGVRALPPPSSAALASSSFSSPSSSSRAPSTHTAGLRLVSSGREVSPALGLAWASCVGIRLFLARLAPVGSSSSFGGGGGGGDDGGGNIFPPAARAAATRRLQVVFAPHLPAPSSCLATVDERGLVGVGDNGEAEEGKKRQWSPAAAATQQQPVVCSGVFA